jgi:hypothetical protein
MKNAAKLVKIFHQRYPHMATPPGAQRQPTKHPGNK